MDSKHVYHVYNSRLFKRSQQLNKPKTLVTQCNRNVVARNAGYNAPFTEGCIYKVHIRRMGEIYEKCYLTRKTNSLAQETSFVV